MNNRELELFSVLYARYTNKDDLYEDLIGEGISMIDLRIVAKRFSETASIKLEEFAKKRQEQLERAIRNSEKSLSELRKQLTKYSE